MITTLSVMKKRQIVLPKPLCEQINIDEGTPMRAIVVNGSIVLTPIKAPSASEYRAIIKAAGRPLPKEPRGTPARIKRILRKVRARDHRA